MKSFVAKAAVAALLLSPVAAAAQSSFTVHVTPRVGLLTPADYFYEEFAHLGVDPLEWTNASILRSVVAGLGVQLEIGDSGLWIRGEVLRTVGTDFGDIAPRSGEMFVRHAILIESSGFDQPYVESQYFYVPTAVTIGSLDLAFPTRFRLPLSIQPYVTAGVGAKRYDFDTGAIDNPDRSIQHPEEGVTLVGNVGVGATVPIAGVTVDLLVRDALSEYWERLQHDVVWLVGLSWQVH